MGKGVLDGASAPSPSRLPMGACRAGGPDGKAADGEVLSGEILTTESVTVTAALHPLSGERVTFALSAGLSVAELAARAYGERRASRIVSELVATIEGEPVPPALWPRLRPKAGTWVTFKPVPRGGLRGILGILLAVAAIAASFFLAGSPLLIAQFGPLGAQLIGAAAAAGIGIVGNLLLNALFPVRPPKLADGRGEQSFAIGGIRNEADPFGPLPVILGRHRVYPRFAAKPYTELVGNQEFLRVLVVWGYGPLAISDLKIGETPLSSFQDVEIQTYEGYPEDPAPTLYPGQAFQESLSVELEPLEWFTRQTAGAIDEISVDVVAPQGVFRIFVKNGSFEIRTVTIDAQYRPVSGGAWLTLGQIVISSKKQDLIRRGLRKAVPRGQYEVRLRRATPANTDPGWLTTDDITWSALRGLRNDPPIRYRLPLAVTALRIRATAQLNGTLETLNGVCASRVTAWSGTDWVTDQPSRNPADLYRWVCQGPANARPLDDQHIDLAGLEQWHAYCAAQGFTYDFVRDARGSVMEALADIAAAGRASPTVIDGRQGVIWDQPAAPIVQHFTPRNARGFSGNRVYKYWPHALRVRFVNAQQGWNQDERIVYDDGQDAETATRFEAIEFPGVTDPDLNWRHARFQIAQARLRPEIFTLEVDFENLVCTRGDRVRVSYDVPLFGIQAARVRAVSAALPQSVTLDETITQEAGGAYAVRFRLADGSSLLRSVTTVAGEGRVLRLVGNGALPDPGDLAMFGAAGSETVVLRVQAVEPGPDLSARLSLVDDAPAISLADQGEIPSYDSQITIPPDPFTLPPVDLAIREAVRVGEDGVPKAAAEISWRVPRFGVIRVFEVEASDSDPAGNPEAWFAAGTVAPPRTGLTVDDLAPGTWWFRVRALFQNGGASAWLESGPVALTELLTPPPDVTNFRIAILGEQATLTWDRVTGIAFSHYRLRYSPATAGVTWGAAPLLLDNVTATSVQLPARAGTYLIKAVEIGGGPAGLESVNAATLVTSLALVNALNAVETVEEHPAWAGAMEDVIYDPELGGIRLADLAATGSGT